MPRGTERSQRNLNWDHNYKEFLASLKSRDKWRKEQQGNDFAQLLKDLEARFAEMQEKTNVLCNEQCSEYVAEITNRIEQVDSAQDYIELRDQQVEILETSLAEWKGKVTKLERENDVLKRDLARTEFQAHGEAAKMAESLKQLETELAKLGEDKTKADSNRTELEREQTMGREKDERITTLQEKLKEVEAERDELRGKWQQVEGVFKMSGSATPMLS